MPQPVFVLVAPRSFSSVFGAMLGQHPQAYGLPELNLFVGDTLAEAWAYLRKGFPVCHDGLLRALAELCEGGQTDEGIARARAWVAAHGDWDIPRVFDHLQAAVGDRRLVEKGPLVTFNAKHLARMQRMFPDAQYLHLVRHPRSSGLSLLGLRDSQSTSRDADGMARSIFDPEQIWCMSNGNAARFADTLPPDRIMRVKGEEVMASPTETLARICDWLGIDAGPRAIEAMLRPEASPYARPGPDSAPLGNDPNFLNRPTLDRDRMEAVAEPDLVSEVDWRPGDFFAPQTVELARKLGYD